MANKKVTTTVYITEEQNQLLKELNRRTKVPVAEFIREGIDLILEKTVPICPAKWNFKLHLENDLKSLNLSTQILAFILISSYTKGNGKQR